MTLEPIIKAKLEKFRKDYLLKDLSEDKLFERFVNYHILSQQQPGIFSTEYELLDKICVGGGNDLGLDGVAISLNGKYVKSCEDIDDVLPGNRKGEFEITFIQSKNKSKFDLGEYLKFTHGVECFLESNISMPISDAIDEIHKIHNYIMSNDIIIKWATNPSIRLCYVVAGTWEEPPHIVEATKSIKERLQKKRCFGDIDFDYIDNKALVNIINSNESCYKVVMDFVDSMPLPEVDQVDNSSVVLCNAREIVNLLSTAEGMLRKNLFEDNVRDYQGETTINTEIRATLSKNSEHFVLLNNGITIVCDEVQEGNRKVSITNPQIVNGCQTCNILFRCSKEGINLDGAYAIVKIIGTSNDEIVNNIVKGTNRQNIVYDEAFETTKEFHKLLEKFFAVMQVKEFDKVFYERRSKQYENDPRVRPYQKISFRILIQSFVSLFLYRVEEGHRHESKLLQDYGNAIFAEHQSFYPYYVAAFIYIQTEYLFRSGTISKKNYSYKLHIMLLIKEMQMGKSPDINNKKEIEKYCKELLKKLEQKSEFIRYAKDASVKFDEVACKWIDYKGMTYRYAMKDSSEFTKFMLKILAKTDEQKYSIEEPALVGKVMNINTDRHGDYFGFIRRHPGNIFFHENENPNINLDYENKEVVYEIAKKNGKEVAINIRLLS